MAASSFPWPTHVDIVSVAAATATLTLNELASFITEIQVLQGGATAVDAQNYSLSAATIGPDVATAGVVQSVAVPTAPADTITFDATNEPAANSQILIRYVAVGDAAAA